MRSRILLAGLLLGAVGVAGCGANNSDTKAIVPPPSQSQTLSFTATSTSTSTTTTPSTTAPAIVTPKTGALATQPKITLPTGPAPTKLVSKDLIVGTGAVAKAGDTITVNYVGELYKNGTIFDASWNRKQPLALPLGEGAVIAGWDQGLVGMRVGGRRELIIPPSLGYKNKADGPIPANSTLIFDVDLLAITPPKGATGVTGATYVSGALGATGSTGSTGGTG